MVGIQGQTGLVGLVTVLEEGLGGCLSGEVVRLAAVAVVARWGSDAGSVGQWMDHQRSPVVHAACFVDLHFSPCRAALGRVAERVVPRGSRVVLWALAHASGPLQADQGRAENCLVLVAGERVLVFCLHFWSVSG